MHMNYAFAFYDDVHHHFDLFLPLNAFLICSWPLSQWLAQCCSSCSFTPSVHFSNLNIYAYPFTFSATDLQFSRIRWKMSTLA